MASEDRLGTGDVHTFGSNPGDAGLGSLPSFFLPKTPSPPVHVMRLAFCGPGSGVPGGGNGWPRPIGLSFVPNGRLSLLLPKPVTDRAAVDVLWEGGSDGSIAE
jgi:hypothetical protein